MEEGLLSSPSPETQHLSMYQVQHSPYRSMRRVEATLFPKYMRSRQMR